MIRTRQVKALVEKSPKRAFRTLAPQLASAARTKDPALAEEIIRALARHGDTLPTAWRMMLVALADEPPFALCAAVGLAQVKPHRSMVPSMIRRVEAKLDACASADFGHSWDDEIALAVLAKCADKRAAVVFERLLEAPKVAHWDLLLQACAKSGAWTLIPAILRWLANAKAEGVTSTWEGFSEGNQVIERLQYCRKRAAANRRRRLRIRVRGQS